MHISSATCSSCGTPLRPAAAFCPACGFFLLKRNQATVVPPLPASKQNPLVALDGTFTPRRDPRSAPTPERWQQRLFMHRSSLASLLEEGELSGVAEGEFEGEVAPKLFEGSMTPLVHDGWRRYWKLVSDSVHELRGRLGDQPDEAWDTNDKETWSNPHPAFAALRQRLRADLNAIVARLGETHGDMVPLIKFELRLQGSVAALQRLTSQLEALRLGESLHALTWIRELNEAGIRKKHDVDDMDALIKLAEKVQEQFHDHRNRLHPQEASGQALAARYNDIEGALAQLVKTDPEFYLDAQEWLQHVVRRLVFGTGTSGLLDKVLKVNRSEAWEIKEATQRAIYGVMQDFLEEVKRCAGELRQEVEQERQDAAHRRESQAAAERAASFQSVMVDELLTKQQALRQQSEGKFGLALATQVFGAQTGSAWEGLFK
jgi:hypothetical protein